MDGFVERFNCCVSLFKQQALRTSLLVDIIDGSVERGEICRNVVQLLKILRVLTFALNFDGTLLE